MKRMLILLCCLLSISIGYAASNATPSTQNISIILDHLELIKEGEVGGDELYIDMSIAKSNTPTEFIRIPEKPMHWPSRLAKQIKNVSLWSGTLAPNQKLTALISLLESDDSIINVDDFIGSMQVMIENQKDHLTLDWKIPDASTQPKTLPKNIGEVGHYRFSGSNGTYEIYIKAVTH